MTQTNDVTSRRTPFSCFLDQTKAKVEWCLITCDFDLSEKYLIHEGKNSINFFYADSFLWIFITESEISQLKRMTEDNKLTPKACYVMCHTAL